VVSSVRAVTNVGAVTSAEAFGTSVVGRGTWNILDTGAIATGEGFGQPVVSQSGGSLQSISTQTIASQEQFGTAVLARGAVSITGHTIASTEAFGTPVLGGLYRIQGMGIPPEEAFGLPRISITVSSVGAIASGEAFGLTKLSYVFALSSLGNIVSQEAFGILFVDGGAYIFGPKPIANVVAVNEIPEVVVELAPRAGATVSPNRPIAEVIRG
jgi:hypothetical protein